MATATGWHPAQRRFVLGPTVPVPSTMLTLLLALSAIAAKPSLGEIATPSGPAPTETGEPIVPTTPAVPPPKMGVSGERATRLTVPSTEFVTTARSRSVSIATPTGVLPTTTA